MRLHIQIPLPGAVTEVGAMLADPAYVHAKVAASGATDHHADVAGDAAGAFTVTTRRSMPTDQIPANMRSLVGSALDVRLVEAWEPELNGSRCGTIVVEISGAPVRLTGTTLLEPGPEGSSLVYEGEVKAAIPLFAATVEGAAAQAIRGALDAEETVARSWLAGHRPASTP